MRLFSRVITDTSGTVNGGGSGIANRIAKWSSATTITASTWQIDGFGDLSSVTFGQTISVPGLGTSSEQFGSGSNAAGDSSVAVGSGANALGAYSIAIGQVSQADNFSVSIGKGATSAGFTQGIIIGYQSYLLGDGGTVVGFGAFAGISSCAFGNTANAPGNLSIAIGLTAACFLDNAIAIGGVAYTSYATVVGVQAAAQGSYGTTLGYGANSSQDYSICIGASCTAATGGQYAVIAGYSTSSASYRSVLIGHASFSFASLGNVGIGAGVTVGIGDSETDSGCIAVGYLSTSQGDKSICIGRASSVSVAGAQSIVVGAASTTTNSQMIIIGYNVNPTDASGSTIIGYGADISLAGSCICIGTFAAIGDGVNDAGGSTVIGNSASCYSQNGLVIGTSATIGLSNTNSVAIGIQANVGAGTGRGLAIGEATIGTSCDYSTAIGGGATIGNSTTYAIALGPSAQVQGGSSNGIAIGAAAQVQSSCTNGIAIGNNAVVFSGVSGSTAIGYSVTAFNNNVLAIGASISSTAANQCLIGTTTGLTDFIFGKGPNDSAPVAITFYPTVRTGTNAVGADFTIAAGNGTGNAGSGKLIFQTAPTGTSGSSLGTLTTRISILNSGFVAVGSHTPTNKLDVDGAISARSSGSATNLTADNQSVTVGDRSHIILSSDNATPTNRTFTLTNGLTDGQFLVIEWSGTNAGEIAAATNIKLAGGTTMTFGQYDVLTLIWSANASAWLEIGRAANS